MKQARIGVIINPISGRRGARPGEANRRRAFVEREITAAGAEADVRLTQAHGHAAELARACAAAGCDVVVAMGGDGTVNEVAQGLIGGPVPLGVLPCGSGDGLAKGLGLPGDWRTALRVAMTGATTRIDVGYANDRPFLNIAGIGFDAAVAQSFAIGTRRGGLAYVVRTLDTVKTYQPLSYEIVCDDERRVGRKFLVGFANAPEYGNHAVMSPDADVRDGLLDVLMIDAGSTLAQIWRGRRLFWRHRAPARGVDRLKTRAARVTGDRIVYHLDGEPFETSGTLHITVAPQALSVRVPITPRASKELPTGRYGGAED